MDTEEEKREKSRMRLRMRRLFRWTTDAKNLPPSELIRVKIAGVKRSYFAFADDGAGLLSDTNAAGETLHLLAPLDPLVYDRDRLKDLWDFDYTWEVYVPQAKRKWGYYVLPVLCGDKLIARLDPKIDRASGILRIKSLLWEQNGVPSSYVERLQDAISRFGNFLGATQIECPALD